MVFQQIYEGQIEMQVNEQIQFGVVQGLTLLFGSQDTSKNQLNAPVKLWTLDFRLVKTEKCGQLSGLFRNVHNFLHQSKLDD